MRESRSKKTSDCEFPGGNYYLVGEVCATDDTFAYLGDFVQTIDSDLDAILERKRLVAAAEAGSLAKEDLHAFLQEQRERAFSRLVGYSTLLTVALTVEAELVRFCNIIRHEFDLPIGPGDVKGDLLERSRKYIQDVAKWPGCPSPEDWLWLRDVFELRHKVVHEAGEFADGDQTHRLLRPLVSRRPGIQIERNLNSKFCQLNVTLSFCRSAVHAGRCFFVRLYEPFWLHHGTWTDEQKSRHDSKYTERRYSDGAV